MDATESTALNEGDTAYRLHAVTAAATQDETVEPVVRRIGRDWMAAGKRPRVMLAWEHGRNFGRLARLLAVARMVEEQGGEPVWVVPRSQRSSPALMALSHRRVVSPAIEQQTFAPNFRADSFADVLLSTGFDDADTLLAATHPGRRSSSCCSLNAWCWTTRPRPSSRASCWACGPSS